MRPALRGRMGLSGRLNRRTLPLVLMFLPGFALFILFKYVPFYGIQVAFKDYRILDGMWASPWAGLSHFRRLFTGPGFGLALRNTLIIAFLKLLFVFPAPVVLALLLNELRNRVFKRVIQTVSYLPHFFSWVILAGLLFTFFSYDGAYNAARRFLGLDGLNPLIQPEYFYTVVVGSAVWAKIGWSSIVYLAALASVDPQLYEAALVDGAGRWRQVRHITLPSIVSVIVIMLLLYLGDFLSVGFDQIYNLMTPPTMQVADILDTYVLRRLLNIDYELGAAAGLFSSILGLTLVLTANRIVKALDPEQGLW